MRTWIPELAKQSSPSRAVTPFRQPAMAAAGLIALQDLFLDVAQELGQVGDRFGEARSEAEQV